MLNTNILIKDIAFDIISIITIWGFCNNIDLNIYVYNKIYYINTNFIGLGFSTYFLIKYI